MSLKPLAVGDDPRVKRVDVDLNGRKYNYILAEPKGRRRGTVFLIHGWPDLSMGWRYQIPMFQERGFRVVAPDIIGFGRTQTPDGIEAYSLKRTADDINALAAKLQCSSIILGGHDWGGAAVFRVALWYPKLISHLFSVCTPYHAPNHGPDIPLQTVVEKYIPSFGYQLQLSSGEVGKHVDTYEKIKGFIKGIYGGKGPNGEMAFTIKTGVQYDNLLNIGKSPLLSDEEADFYAREYMRNGFESPLGWYKTRSINWKDELAIKEHTLQMPTLFIAASGDAALPPSLSEGMDEHIPKLTRRQVDTTHWALIEAPKQVNDYIWQWLEPLLSQEGKSVL
ncbi:MAG: hypothetical protein GOMPHAMPRED_002417 [Gomphillus americanus]|uniref:AB hydrolase-1 domain-containing protein n=1 Tax=Gomphillus americanus TaxID=1940652 RepID=A0A8H3FDX2_9LECA|nr:MAG: hypothetical protein GOMPHAMPRED_002417 [Gomphillus americanus]